MFGQSILILVPHADDEVVACAASIRRAQEAGAQIYALYLTNGCVAQDVMWPWQRGNYQQIIDQRRAEAEQVAHVLNVTPIGCSPRPARYLWRQMKEVYAEIQTALAVTSIDQVWLPAYEGGNPDHDALNAIGQKLKNKTSVLEFAEYNFFGGQTHSQIFPYPNGSEQVIELTKPERDAKCTALALYKSETSNLTYVALERECYRPLADYDYSQPPHPGKLWYARFQWVPFRHPRVDFTNPKDVSGAISSFMQDCR